MTAETQRVCRLYCEAWMGQDRRAIAHVQTTEFRFAAGDMGGGGHDAFLNAGAFPRDAKTTMVAEAYQGNAGFQMYDSARAGLTVRIVEQLTVREGVVVSSIFITDMGAFTSFVRA
ncbi:MAG: hypothetical protein EXR66_05555 [Dehalococcoidia bacterium]|nr:hypothetical protein [Dehalococcoidia bacterium]